jgi:hypothetical protein
MGPDDDYDDDDLDRTKIGIDVSTLAAEKSERDRPYLIVLAGPNVGEMYPIDGAESFVGRGANATIRLGDDSISRRHVRIVLDGKEVRVEDLGSANGTVLNGERVTAGPLRDGDKIQLGATTILKFTYHDKLEEGFRRQMYDSALRDGLTKVFNKKHLLDRLTVEFAFARRHQTPLALDGDTTSIDTMSELGPGLRERVLPPVALPVPLREFVLALERFPHAILPLKPKKMTPRRIVLVANEETRTTTMPPPMIEISEESLASGPRAVAPPQRDGSDSQARLAAPSASEEDAEDVDSGRRSAPTAGSLLGHSQDTPARGEEPDGLHSQTLAVLNYGNKEQVDNTPIDWVICGPRSATT